MLNISSAQVQKKRVELNIDSSYDTSPIDWPPELLSKLGVISDYKLSKQYGMSKTTLLQKRRSLGIEAVGPARIVLTSEQEALLGTMPDSKLAGIVGTFPAMIKKKREELGIPKFVKPAAFEKARR